MRQAAVDLTLFAGGLCPKAGSVSCGAGVEPSPEMVTQRVCGAEPGGCRDLLNRHPGRFQQIAGLRHAFLKHPLTGGYARRLFEPSDN